MKLKSILKGVVEVIEEGELKQRLELSRRLRIKAGFDPTSPDIHLGHTLLLEKLRQFQELGHMVYLLIGDFTASIGDPSSQDKTRPTVTEEQIKDNAATYQKQIFKILARKRTHIVFNSCWLSNMGGGDILRLASYVSIAQLLARADFRSRYEKGQEINLQEFFYPLLQAYDSVYLKSDLEIGGIDQKFNLLMGRQLQQAFKQKPQVIMMLPLLEGTDGIKKMSKSLNNYIGIQEPADEIFGKVMSISDELMWRYYELLTAEDLNELKKMHPKEAKLRLAQALVNRYHTKLDAKKAKIRFEEIFSQGKNPKERASYKLKQGNIQIIELLLNSGLSKSNNEARRLVRQGAVKFDGERISDEKAVVERGLLQVGKRKWLEIIPANTKNDRKK